MEPFSIQEKDKNGVFCRILFDDLDHPLLLFIADQDYETLRSMAEKQDVDWKKFRSELFTLVEHSGHKDKHELSEQTVRDIREAIKNLPDQQAHVDS